MWDGCSNLKRPSTRDIYFWGSQEAHPAVLPMERPSATLSETSYLIQNCGRMGNEMPILQDGINALRAVSVHVLLRLRNITMYGLLCCIHVCQEIQGRATGPHFGRRLRRAPNLHRVYRGRNSSFVKLTGNSPCRLERSHKSIFLHVTMAPWHQASVLLITRYYYINPGKHTPALMISCSKWNKDMKNR